MNIQRITGVAHCANVVWPDLGGVRVNPNPFRARQEKKARGKPLEIAEVLAMVSDALRRAESLLQDATDPDYALRCIHALSQTAGQYSRLVSEGELEARIRTLEETLRGKVA